ncbi:hypothetical protein [uncultured Desulfobacter sp.]|uniref:hypothetical protein n=1 Tax=uncultured Desulfobacter sp. TaxID=240139 RepID=UPI002AAB35AD|nr:hypothetical protein [uncultured Desulfobacter sp.]
MKITLNDNPRLFGIGEIQIKDFGTIFFEPCDMISIHTNPGKYCDITATDWGFYLGSSVNGRMKENGFRVALVINSQEKLFVNAVDEGKLTEFHDYLKKQNSRVLQWLD